MVHLDRDEYLVWFESLSQVVALCRLLKWWNNKWMFQLQRRGTMTCDTTWLMFDVDVLKDINSSSLAPIWTFEHFFFLALRTGTVTLQLDNQTFRAEDESAGSGSSSSKREIVFVASLCWYHEYDFNFMVSTKIMNPQWGLVWSEIWTDNSVGKSMFKCEYTNTWTDIICLVLLVSGSIWPI